MSTQNPTEIPLAIVGMACRVPGADNLDEYWRLLMEGRTVLGELPAERLDRSLYYNPKKGLRTKSYTTLGGFVPHRPFDEKNCPRPGKLYDRAHKVHLNLLEVAAAAARHAGYDPFHMPKVSTGVYVGHTPPSSMVSRLIHARLAAHTARYLKDVPGVDALLGEQTEDVVQDIVRTLRGEFVDTHPAHRMNCNAYHGPGAIATAFQTDGPCMSFDAACASSMRALAHGARALQLGQIDMAIVGGASFCHADTLILFSAAQSLTSNFSRPFDANADGLIASEAYAVIMVKTLEKALADGDKIQAVIRGIGLSSDGKGKSLWAPRREGQIEAVRRAYPQGFTPAKLQYIEAHATSTQLGDATELGALHTAIGDQLPAGKKLIVGSVKGNIGHSLETAGMASIVKTVLAMQHGVIPPQCGLKDLNPDVSWNDVPFTVPTHQTAWPAPAAGEVKCAAVNAFGIGGLNVHVILQEHQEPASRKLISAVPGPKAGQPLDVMKDGPLPLRDGIAIVGMGAVLPGARTVDALWDVFGSGRDLRIQAPEERWIGEGETRGVGQGSLWLTPTRTGGFITDFEYDWKKHKVPPRQVQFADPLQFMLLDATDQALKNAGYDTKPFDRTRTGVVVGTVFGGEFADQLQMGLRLPEFQKLLKEKLAVRGVSGEECERIADEYEDILLKRMPALVDETGSFTASTLASRLTKTFDLMGGAVAVDAGDGSATAALSNCIDMLLAGDTDMMICASGQRNMGYAWYLSMNRNELLSQGEPSAPFDSKSTGGVPGEMAGVVVLKRLSDALRDGDRIHGIIRGIGCGNHDDLEKGMSMAIRRGLQSARITADQVSVLEAGSSGIPEDDRKELKGIINVYNTPTRTQPLYVGAAAGQIGHTQGASGMVGLMKAVTELGHIEVAKNVGLADPLPEWKAGDGKSLSVQPVFAPSKLQGINEDGRMFAAVNTHSTCNGAFHLILEGPQRVPPAARPTKAAATMATNGAPSTAPRRAALTPEAAAWKLVRFSAASVEALLAEVAQLGSSADARFAAGAGFDELTAGGPSTYNVNEPFRLAVVAKSAAELADLCGLAVKQLPKPEARGPLAEKGIFFGERLAKPRVAFLYPGQGSQYSGMLKSLVTGFGPAADALAMVDGVLARLELPAFSSFAWDDAERLGTDVWITQLALLAADTIANAAVRSLGLKAERVGGHSFGELVALAAADAWTFEDAVRATAGRCQSIEACRNAKGALLSTTAPATVADTFCAEVCGTEVGTRVYVSHRNAPDQSVVGGDPAAVKLVGEKLAAAGYRTKMLDVPAAFHTPLMEEVKGPFGAALAGIPLEPPMIPLLSSVTNRYVSDPADIRDNLVVQMTQPVYWIELVERLYSEGFNVLVEVGPKQVLTGLQKQILAGKDVYLVGTDHPKRDGLQQLMFVRACVEVSGALDTDACGVAGPSIGVARPESLKGVVGTVETAPAAAPVQPATVQPAAPQPAAAQAAIESIEQIGTARVLRLSGSPYEMGLQHGRAEGENIRRVLRRYADLAGTRWDITPQVEEAVANPEVWFGDDELEELRGIAKGAGVAPEALIAHNLRMFLDVGAGGLHFAIRHGEGGAFLHGGNEDLQPALCLRDCLERHVQVRTPANGIPHIAFCIVGQVGTLNGINAAGLALSTSALVDVPKGDVAAQWLHTVLVKRVLEKATDIDSAIPIIRTQRSAGAWTACLSHHPSNKLCYVEFDGRELKVTPSADQVLAANHRQLKTFAAAEKSLHGGVPAHSKNRMDRMRRLLDDVFKPITPETVRAALRDRFDTSRGRDSEYPTLNTVRRVDNQISFVVHPAKDELWITAGPLANGHANDFQCLKLSRLLPALADAGKTVAKPASASTAKTDSPTTASKNVETAKITTRNANALQETSTGIKKRDLATSYANAKSAKEKSGDVCQRYVLRVVEAPLKSGAPRVTGSVIVAGSNAAAEALSRQLAAAGLNVSRLAIPASANIDSLQAEVDGLMAATPSATLIMMTAWDEAATTTLAGDEWSERRQTGASVPFFVAQRWFERVNDAKALDTATFVAVTTMGGDFGVSGTLQGVENGALSGLVKGLDMEVRLSRGAPNFRGKLIDFARSADVNDVAAKLTQELTAGDDEQEVGYFNGVRVAARPVPQPVPAATQTPEAGSVFVVTGGARGVTAAVARELGRQFGVRLHLIGASPVPAVPAEWQNLDEEGLKVVKAQVMKDALGQGQKPADAWSRFEKALEIHRTLSEFAAEGLHATYHACDVGNRDALSAVLDTIRQDGPITGVIHGAGFERACRFEKKQRDLVERTLSAKVDGAANLMALTQNDPVRWFAAFGSVAGRFGGVGQADYCVANEMLAKLIDWYRTQRPECASAVFHWHAWDDVGMAVRPESAHIRKLHNIKFMPAVEGTRHLLSELQAGLPEREIAITELDYCLQRYGQVSDVQEVEPRPEVEAAHYPLVDRVLVHTAGESLTTEIDLDPVRDVFLAQHLFKGRPLMPVVASIEALTNAAMQFANPGERVVAVHNVELITGLRFLTDAPQTARVQAQRFDNKVICALTSDVVNRKGQVLQKDKPYLRATVELGTDVAAPTAEMPVPVDTWYDVWYPEVDAVIWHGLPFRCLRQMTSYQEDCALGTFVAPASNGLAPQRAGEWLTPAALLDACFFASGVFLWYRHAGVVAIPDGIGRLSLGRIPRADEKCLVIIRDNGRDGDKATFDFTLFGEDGSVVVAVEGYRNVIVAEEPAHAG